jgi:hypothetical protein
MVPLRFLRCWNGYDRGAEVSFPHPGLAEDLVRMGIAQEIKPAVGVPTPAAGAGTPATPTPAVPVPAPRKKK